MKFFIVCPENLKTGGTELAHQLCLEITKSGYYAAMYYINISNGSEEPVDADTPEKFKRYTTNHVKSAGEVNLEEDVIIVPEALTDWAFSFRPGKVCIWWMSVDNFRHRDNDRYIRLLDFVSVFHLVQSEYAAEFLRSKNINEDKLIWLSDYISDRYLGIKSVSENRKNKIVYNPQKGFDRLEPLINMCDFAEWKALKGMTEDEMIDNMTDAKIYIDFGNHPGKDRIPREAAICGCCVITNKRGSAAYYGDVPLDDEFKFDEPVDYKALIEKIRDIFDNFDEYYKKFDSYRDWIRQEKEYFEIDAEGFVHIFTSEKA